MSTKKEKKSSEKPSHIILNSSEKKAKHTHYVKENQRIFLTLSLLIFFVASLFLSFVLVPLSLFLNTPWLYVLIAIYGFFTGIIFHYMLVDLKYVAKKYIKSLFIFIPLIFCFSIIVFMVLGSEFAYIVNMDYMLNNFYVVIFSVLGFFAGLFIYTFKEIVKDIFKF